ncbi:MAG: homoserine kinase [Proteobacteria bacterium]|nr:homoserine kinase [Pseudomonadota bacterium]
MAVFTPVSLPLLNDWLRTHYALPAANGIAPISEGIENTNCRVQMGTQEYVLTIFELWDDTAVNYYTALMQHFHAAGLPVPAAVVGIAGKNYHHWQAEGVAKPAALVPFIAGAWVATPNAEHCRQIGALLAQLHIHAARFNIPYTSPRNHAWRQDTAGRIREHLTAEQQQLLDRALKIDADFSQAALPAAACHCDLFRNNVLWHNDHVNAVIDFYFGGDEVLLFDLAVCICDWCYHDGQFDPDLLSALLQGYNSQRHLCDLEKQLFVDALNSAAIRFWLSRHFDVIFPRRAEELTPHDPAHFEQILRTIHSQRNFFEQLMKAAA